MATHDPVVCGSKRKVQRQRRQPPAAQRSGVRDQGVKAEDTLPSLQMDGSLQLSRQLGEQRLRCLQSLLWAGVDSIRFTQAPRASHAAKIGTSITPQTTLGRSEPSPATTATRTMSAIPANHAPA